MCVSETKDLCFARVLLLLLARTQSSTICQSSSQPSLQPVVCLNGASQAVHVTEPIHPGFAENARAGLL
jgi:hypothetical protein